MSSSLVGSGGISLESIGLTLGLGLCVSFITVIAFGIMVMKRHTNIAPRCTARHPNTIWRRRKDMYGKSKKKKKNKQTKKAGGGKKATASNMNGANDRALAENDQNNNDKHQQPPQPPSIIKRNSSLQDFTVKAPKIAANAAAKIVTGVDMNGMSRSQRNIQQMEEQKQQRDFVQNSMGQAVFVGRNTVNSIVEKRPSGSSKGGLSPQGGSPEENLDDLLADVFTAAAPPPPQAVDVGDPVVKDPEMGFVNDEHEMISDDDNELSDGVDDTELSDKMYAHPQDRGNPFLVSFSHCNIAIYIHAPPRIY